MKNILSLLLVPLLAVNGAQAGDTSAAITNIEGTYQCSGECVITTTNGGKSLISVTGEVDKIARWKDSKYGIYKIDITGSNNFKEQEIGSLVGHQMQTATANVSDAQYPVLEQYIFQGNPSGQATRYTKTVLNPSNNNFKACSIVCNKQ